MPRAMSNQHLQDVLETNCELWNIWSTHGIGDGSTFAIDFHFYAARSANGERVATILREAGFSVKTQTTRTLLIFKGLDIEATEHASWTLERLQERTRELVALAARVDVLFDGLGAEMPDPAA
jgi:Regulator of ribonuclease activity B